MSRSRRSQRRLLRWYPRPWRDRYGAELVALVEEMHPDGVPLATVVTLAASGLRQRSRAVTAAFSASYDQPRTGPRLILWGWVLIVLAGLAIAKVSEHWQAAVPPDNQWVPKLGIAVASASALVALVPFVIVAVMAAPLFVRVVWSGGLRQVRRQLITAAAVVVPTVGLTAVTLVLSRGSSTGGVRVVGWIWAALVVASGFALTSLITAIERRLSVPRRTEAAWSQLAHVVSVAAFFAVAGVVTWWAAVSASAPRYFAGSGAGLFNAPWVFTMIPVVIFLTGGLACCVGGERHIARASRV